MTEDEMVGWHHRLNGHGFQWTPGVGDGQAGLACCSPWGCKETDTTERLNLMNINIIYYIAILHILISNNNKSVNSCTSLLLPTNL